MVSTCPVCHRDLDVDIHTAECRYWSPATPTQTMFIKHDQAKPRISLIPVQPLLDVAQVLQKGVEKYGEGNWKNCPDLTRYYDAAMRHMFAYHTGEANDPETGLPHLAHATCCLLFLLELTKDKK